jgi:type IV pilus assembly protein PilA
MEVRPRARSQSGFTLVELLVLILVLEVVALIAGPAFLSQRDKARDGEAKVQVRTAQTAIEAYAGDRKDNYADASVAALQEIEPALRDLTSANLTVQTLGSSGQYTVAVLAPTGNEFTIRRQNDGSFSFPCTMPGAGGCPASGSWG